jgi:hypothetical protein
MGAADIATVLFTSMSGFGASAPSASRRRRSPTRRHTGSVRQ